MIIFGIFTGLKITTNIVPLFKKAIAWKILNSREKKITSKQCKQETDTETVTRKFWL